MAGKKQSAIRAQPSGVFEQEVVTQEIPLSVTTPAKKSRRGQGTTDANQIAHSTDALVASSGFTDTLADRIKSGSGRRKTKTTTAKTDVGAAAVNALADIIDAMIMPGQGRTERYLDSRDADLNVPDHIPGASSEQRQHAKQPAARQAVPSGQASGHAPDGTQTPELRSRQPAKKRQSKVAKPGVIQIASELAQGPDVYEDKLQEDEKVTKRRRSRKQLFVEDATEDALAASAPPHPLLSHTPTSNPHQTTTAVPGASAAAAAKPQAAKRKRTASSKASEALGLGVEVDGEGSMPVVTPKHRQASKKAGGAGEATPAEAVAAAVEAVTSDGRKKKVKRQRVKASEVAVSTEVELVETSAEGKPQNRKTVTVEAAEMEAVVEGTPEGATIKATTKKSRAKAESKFPPFEMPGREVLETARCWTPTPRPIPNLGYACLNMDLREQKPPIFTNRDMVQKTFKQKGLPYVSQLALENSRAMKALVQWNHEHSIRFFRMTSNIFPWCTFYNLEDLPDFPAIADELAFAGELARAYDQRLTFHPSHFVKVAAAEEQLLQRSLKELEVHSQVMDMMGFEPSHWNKINIHIGGVYGDKLATLDRFAQNFERLSANCKARLTLENDDWPCAFAVKDLLPLSRKCSIPIVFDFHHHKFCSGDWSEKEAFFAALETWPKDVRPAVHWSESQPDRKPHAHSDYIQGPMNLHGKEADVDVMIEAKCKERTLLRFRDGAPDEAEPVSHPDPAAELATKFL
ncbi:hypothetical protein ABBQ38_002945 [Trebouxia sp. C0009 RCD-2024]